MLAQDARFQQAVLTYRDTVLRANEEVENGIVSFLREQDRVASLTVSTNAAARSVAIATQQYEKGTIDYQPLLDSERVLVQQQDTLAESRGLVGIQSGGRLQSPRRRLAGTTDGQPAADSPRFPSPPTSRCRRLSLPSRVVQGHTPNAPNRSWLTCWASLPACPAVPEAQLDKPTVAPVILGRLARESGCGIGFTLQGKSNPQRENSS